MGCVIESVIHGSTIPFCLKRRWMVGRISRVNGYSVCSYEVSSPESKSNIKLPDVCKQFGVPFVNPYDVLEKLDVRMILSKRATGA